MAGGNSVPSSVAPSHSKARFSRKRPSTPSSSAPPAFVNTVKQSERRRSRRLQTKPPINNPSSYVDQSGYPVKCCICSKCNLGQAIIKCNNCRKCVHSYCLSPPLNQIPTRKSSWKCLGCVARTKQGIQRMSGRFTSYSDAPSVPQFSANTALHSVRLHIDTEIVPLRRENSGKRRKLSLGTNTPQPVPKEFVGKRRVHASLVDQSMQCSPNGSIWFKASSNTRYGNCRTKKSNSAHAPLRRSSVHPVVGQGETDSAAAGNETLLGSQLTHGVDKDLVKGCNRTYREVDNHNEHLTIHPKKPLPANGHGNAGNFDVWDQEAVLQGPAKTLGILNLGSTDFRSISFGASLASPHIQDVADEEEVKHTSEASGPAESVMKKRMQEDRMPIPMVTPLLVSERSTGAAKANETDRYPTDILPTNSIIPTVASLISATGRKHSEKGSSPSGIVDPVLLLTVERPTSDIILPMAPPKNKRHEFMRGTYQKRNEGACQCQEREKCQGKYQCITGVNKNSVVKKKMSIGNFSSSFVRSLELGFPIIQSERPRNVSMGSVGKGGHSPPVENRRAKERLSRVETRSVSQLHAEQTGTHCFDNAPIQLMAADDPNFLTYFPPSTSIPREE